MSFPIFDYSLDLEQIMQSNDPLEGLLKLQGKIGSDSLPNYLLDYVAHFLPNGSGSVALHPSSSVEGMKDANWEKIERSKGLFGQVTRNNPDAAHHFKIFFNSKNRARLIYKFTGNITFIKNVKNA